MLVGCEGEDVSLPNVCVCHVFDCDSDDITCNAFDLFIFYSVSGTLRQSDKGAAKKNNANRMAEKSRKSQW